MKIGVFMVNDRKRKRRDLEQLQKLLLLQQAHQKTTKIEV